MDAQQIVDKIRLALAIVKDAKMPPEYRVIAFDKLLEYLLREGAHHEP